MMKAEQRPGKTWQRKCVARWRLLSARGLDLQAAAAEIGVSADDLAAWSLSFGPGNGADADADAPPDDH